MKKALVIGGNSGIGLAITLNLIGRGYDHVYIVGKDSAREEEIPQDARAIFAQKTSFEKVNFSLDGHRTFVGADDVDTLIFTAGFGRVAAFENLTAAEVENLIKCNFLAGAAVLKRYYHKIKSKENFYCAVMGSIAGHVVSPLFSTYGAAKSGLCRLIENLNAELQHDGYENRILDVSPGSLKGTRFHGGATDVGQIGAIADEIVRRAFARETLFIPQYDEIYKRVLDDYHRDPQKAGLDSYDYKLKAGRISDKPQVVVGYLSGTFDLFHVGHLNLLRRAKEYCDYLIVGVHDSGAWKGKQTFIPLEERKAVVGSVRYVDRVVDSFREDSDAYDAYHYDKLFVGSDYKGTERFLRYEEYFKDKGVEIVYFPYTQGTSSTQLREALQKK